MSWRERESGSQWHERGFRWHSRSIGVRVGIVLAGLVVAAGFFVLGGYILVWLWNWLMPAIFGLPVISFWQAWGLLVLSSILFKRHPSVGQARNDRRRKRALRERMRDIPDNEDGTGSETGTAESHPGGTY